MPLSPSQQAEVARLTPKVSDAMRGWGRSDDETSDAMLYLCEFAERHQPGPASLWTQVYGTLRKRYGGKPKVRTQAYTPLDYLIGTDAEPASPKPVVEGEYPLVEGLTDKQCRFAHYYFGLKMTIPEASQRCGVGLRTGERWMAKLRGWAAERLNGRVDG